MEGCFCTMKIAVDRPVYVGRSLIVLFAQHNDVVDVDVVKEKVYTRDLLGED